MADLIRKCVRCGVQFRDADSLSKFCFDHRSAKRTARRVRRGTIPALPSTEIHLEAKRILAMGYAPYRVNRMTGLPIDEIERIAALAAKQVVDEVPK